MTVYFDNAATTKPCPEAVEAVYKALTEDYGNPSSSHAFGRRAQKLLREARADVAKALGADENEVYFTSGGTEGDNWAISSAAKARRHNGRHIITSLAEHDAVRKTMARLERDGYTITLLRPDSTGAVTAEQVRNALREDTSLVSLMLVNNETGAITDIAGIAKMLKSAAPQVILHTDAVQGFLKIPFTAKTLGADIINISAHKIHGPKGVGAVYVRSGLRIESFMSGGGQERGMRPGTEPMPAILGFGAASRVGRETFDADTQHMRTVRDFLKGGLQDAFPGAVFVGSGEAPHIINVSLPGYQSEILMNVLDAAGIYVAKSSACKKGARSHVLEAMGLPDNIIDGAIRISLSKYSTADEAAYFIKTLADAVSQLRTKRR